MNMHRTKRKKRNSTVDMNGVERKYGKETERWICMGLKEKKGKETERRICKGLKGQKEKEQKDGYAW